MQCGPQTSSHRTDGEYEKHKFSSSEPTVAIRILGWSLAICISANQQILPVIPMQNHDFDLSLLFKARNSYKEFCCCLFFFFLIESQIVQASLKLTM